MVQEPKPLKKKAQIEQDEAYARELKAKLNRNINWDDVIEQVKIKEKTMKMKEQLEEEKSRALKRTSESLKEKASKKQKLDEEVDELKKHLQIVPNNDDDVYTEATPLALKRRYPLTRFTLDQMLNNVRLEVEEERYESKKYYNDEDADRTNHAEDANGTNHLDMKLVKRGITRLYKFCRKYGKPSGIKINVTFDALNRVSRLHIALFLSFLGDLVREHIGLKILSWKKVDKESRDKLWDEITQYFNVDLTVKKLVLHRLGKLLSNFKMKLREKYIFSNLNTPSKLNELLANYSVIMKAEEWVEFVNYTTINAYKEKLARGKMTRSKNVNHHKMGQGGHVFVKEKMIKNKEIKADEEPPCGIMWLKGRVNKDGEFTDDHIRSVGDKLKEANDNIKEGTLNLDDGTDAMTVMFDDEKEGYARGVGS
nr:hypothetical protein [Tanacetum cinerariifolium]